MPRRQTLSVLAAGLLAVLIASPVLAQCVSLTTPGSAYTQNFGTLSSTAGSTTNNLTITGWFLTESGLGARDNEQYGVDTGGSNTGDVYSYGAAGNAERALGALRSGTLVPLFGACFTNNTGTTVTSLDVAYTGEQWRLGTAARTDQINFQYSTNATDLATGTWTPVAALNFTTPDTATLGAKDGNAAATRTALATTIPALGIANGATFWIRWTDTDASGADDGLAVDDFSLTPQGGVVLPALNIGNVTLAEGDPPGTTTFTFAVTLTTPAGPGGVTFDIATADNTADDRGQRLRRAEPHRPVDPDGLDRTLQLQRDGQPRHHRRGRTRPSSSTSPASSAPTRAIPRAWARSPTTTSSSPRSTTSRARAPARRSSAPR